MATPLMGKFFFTTPAKPFLGKIVCTFRDSWGNLFSDFRGFATQVEKSHPNSSSVWDWPIVWTLQNILGLWPICDCSLRSLHKFTMLSYGCASAQHWSFLASLHSAKNSAKRPWSFFRALTIY